MAINISTGFLAALFFFAIVNISETAFVKWNITEILPLGGITGEEICRSGDTYDSILCGPTSECYCCSDWCHHKCSGMSSDVDNQKCTKFINSAGYPTTTCECCCSPPAPRCKTGDIFNAFECGPTGNCDCCTKGCDEICDGMGSSVNTQKCTEFTNKDGNPTLLCECCCKGSAATTTTTSTLKLSRSFGSSGITG